MTWINWSTFPLAPTRWKAFPHRWWNSKDNKISEIEKKIIIILQLTSINSSEFLGPNSKLSLKSKQDSNRVTPDFPLKYVLSDGSFKSSVVGNQFSLIRASTVPKFRTTQAQMFAPPTVVQPSMDTFCARILAWMPFLRSTASHPQTCNSLMWIPKN